MNSNLREAIENAGKADALMYAIEQSYLDFDIITEECELADRAVFAFYALWDSIKAVRDCLSRLEGDQRVVDVIYAVEKVRQTSTLTEEN